MKICILSPSTLAHQMGGTEVHCQILSRMAAKEGHDVTVITTRHPLGLTSEKKDGYELYYLPATKPARLSLSWWKESSRKIAQLHQHKPFDIIWSENLSGYYYVWRVKKTLGIPCISIIHGAGLLGHIRGEWNRITSFKEIFSFVIKYLPETFIFYVKWFFRTIKYSDAIIGVSTEAREGLQKEFRIDKKKIFMIYNGIDTSLFKPEQSARELIRKQFALDEQNKVILMAGIVHKQKGMHFGLKAFVQIKKKIPEAKMMIAGDGPHFVLLKKLARQLNIDKDVIFCGLIPNNRMFLYYNAADIFINPTVRVEGHPIVAIEAMSCARPMVISSIGGTKSTIVDGESGFYVKPKDVTTLAERTIEILSNPVLLKKMGENARQKVIEEFSQEKMIDGYLQISQNLINQKRN